MSFYLTEDRNECTSFAKFELFLSFLERLGYHSKQVESK